MSHESGSANSQKNKSIVSFKASFWLVVIIVGLFIAALNFIKAESGPEEGKEEAKTSEMKTATEPAENGEKKAEATPAATADTMAKSAK